MSLYWRAQCQQSVDLEAQQSIFTSREDIIQLLSKEKAQCTLKAVRLHQCFIPIFWPRPHLLLKIRQCHQELQAFCSVKCCLLTEVQKHMWLFKRRRDILEARKVAQMSKCLTLEHEVLSCFQHTCKCWISWYILVVPLLGSWRQVDPALADQSL